MTTISSNPAETTALRFDLLTVAEFIQPKEKVLDLGCGDGALLRYLIDRKGVKGRGVELSEEGVLACVRRGVSVRQGNLQEGLGDYPDHSFDTVILSFTIPYINDPAFIIGEMLRVGSRAIVSFPNWGNWRCRLSFLFTGRMPVAAELPQAWDSAPRARPLTVRDFEEFCLRHRIRIARKISLQGAQRIAAQLGENMRSTTAIFELR